MPISTSFRLAPFSRVEGASNSINHVFKQPAKDHLILLATAAISLFIANLVQNRDLLLSGKWKQGPSLSDTISNFSPGNFVPAFAKNEFVFTTETHDKILIFKLSGLDPSVMTKMKQRYEALNSEARQAAFDELRFSLSDSKKAEKFFWENCSFRTFRGFWRELALPIWPSLQAISQLDSSQQKFATQFAKRYIDNWSLDLQDKESGITITF